MLGEEKNSSLELANELNKLRSNELSCYDLLVAAKENGKLLSQTLLIFREYFNDLTCLSGEVQKSTDSETKKEYYSITFNSNNKYLASLLTRVLGRTDSSVSAESRLDSLKSFFMDQGEISDEVLNNLYSSLQAITIHKDTNKDWLVNHIIDNKQFSKDILQHFEPHQEVIDITKRILKFLTDYSITFSLTDNQIRCLAWINTAKFSNLSTADLKNIPKMYSIHNISLHHWLFQKTTPYGDRLETDYFSYDENIKSVLEALNTVINFKRHAFLICSNGSHWATLALVAEKDYSNSESKPKLHILEFNSNLGNMLGVRGENGDILNGFVFQLAKMIESTKLFTAIDTSYKFPLNVQCGNNCGVGSVGFIDMFNRLILPDQTQMPIEVIKEQLPEKFKQLAINPKNLEESTYAYIRNSLEYMVGNHKELFYFDYNNSKLINILGTWLIDLKSQRYSLYREITSLMEQHLSQNNNTNDIIDNFFHSCYTILTLPAIISDFLVNQLHDICFRVKCVYSDEALKNIAKEYYERSIKPKSLDVSKIYSKDLVNLIQLSN